MAGQRRAPDAGYDHDIQLELRGDRTQTDQYRSTLLADPTVTEQRRDAYSATFYSDDGDLAIRIEDGAVTVRCDPDYHRAPPYDGVLEEMDACIAHRGDGQEAYLTRDLDESVRDLFTRVDAAGDAHPQDSDAPTVQPFTLPLQLGLMWMEAATATVTAVTGTQTPDRSR